MLSDALTPHLTLLDREVLDALAGRRIRAERVAQLVHGAPIRLCDRCGFVVRAARPWPDRARWERQPPQRCWEIVSDHESCGGHLRPALTTTPAQRREVLEILHGLEAIGVTENRSGWWRRIG